MNQGVKLLKLSKSFGAGCRCHQLKHLLHGSLSMLYRFTKHTHTHTHTVQKPGTVVASIAARKAQRDIEGKVLPILSFVSMN